ncbi:hypothetical protein OAD21_02155 [Amylibacter sp.]|nr:hypothetical protein [Amylibacter sp.]
MYFKNVLILLLISFIMISPKVNSQEIDSVRMQELILDITDPNESIFKNIKNLEKINIKCGRENGRKVACDTVNGEITLTKRGRSTTGVKIPPVFFDIYPEDGMSMLLDAVIEAIGETDYEMKSISGLVFIFSLTDRSFLLSKAGLVIKTLDK